MERFELTGSECPWGQSPEQLLALAKEHGLPSPRIAYHYGWSNQPKTVRFSAEDWEAAEKLADLVRTSLFPENAEGRLCPMVRSYPIRLLKEKYGSR